MRFKIINQCEYLPAHIFGWMAFIQVTKMTITLTNKSLECDIFEIIHHEYLHQILFNVEDWDAALQYDNVNDFYEFL